MMPHACPGRVVETSKALQKRTEVWLPPSVGRRSLYWGLVGSAEPDQYPERFLERDFFGAIAIEDSSDPDASACERVWNVQVARCEARTPRPLEGPNNEELAAAAGGPLFAIAAPRPRRARRSSRDKVQQGRTERV